MRTKFFKNGIGAMIALAAVTLAMPMFTSCSNEDIAIEVTPVTPVNAKAYVTPVVVADGADVTASAVLSWSSAPISGNGSYYFEGNPDLGATSVTVTATYQGMTGSTQVAIPAVSAGNSYAVVAKIFVSYAPENLVLVLNVEVSREEVENPTNVVSFENASEYTITKEFTYVDIEGSTVLTDDYNGIDEAVLSKIASCNMPYAETNRTISIEIPPYTIVTPEIKTVKTISKYSLNWETRAANTVANLTIEEYETTFATKSVDISHSGHDHDHGHDHGDGSNAGGGILIGD